MSAKPLVDEMMASPSAAPAIALIDRDPPRDNPDADVAVDSGEGTRRRFSIYAPAAAFDLATELDFLTRRSIDQNVFFAPQFLVPAMPRLDERQVRLMVARDEGPQRSRLRFLMPFSVERVGLLGGPMAIRAWTHPFGPLGTPLVDSDDPTGTLQSLLATLRRPELTLPDLLVIPDLRIEEPFACTMAAAAEALGLPTAAVNGFDRAALLKGTALADVLSSKRRREVLRQRRLLAAQGALGFEVARTPAEVLVAMEEFLTLEASGWKGRKRSALIMDRYRAAFAREAVNKLADADRTRIFTLRLDGVAIASLVSFVLAGEAFAWKMAYDERYGAASPGWQMMLMASEAFLADPTVLRVDSCAVPDHFLMNRLWKARIPIKTLVIGLTPESGRRVERAANGLINARAASNAARILRRRITRALRMG